MKIQKMCDLCGRYGQREGEPAMVMSLHKSTMTATDYNTYDICDLCYMDLIRKISLVKKFGSPMN